MNHVHIEKEGLLDEIDQLRVKIYLYAKQEDYSHPELVALSQNLDEKILSIQRSHK